MPTHRGFFVPVIFAPAGYFRTAFPSFSMKHVSSPKQTWPAAGLLLLLLLLVGPGVRAQAPSWQSAVALVSSPSTNTVVSGSAHDANGNLYIAGSFSGQLTLGATTLTAAGAASTLFVAKWNVTTRTYQWAVSGTGTTGQAYISSMAVAGNNVYLTGIFFRGTLTLGGTTLLNNDTNTSTRDIFVAKLTDAGPSASFAWALRDGSLADDLAQSIVVAGTSLYVGGGVASSAYLAKFTDSGTSGLRTWQWLAANSGSANNALTTLALGAANTLYAGGTFSGPSITLGATTLTNARTDASSSDSFIVKITDNGSAAGFGWAQQVSGVGNGATGSSDQLVGLAIQGSSVYAAGYFTGLSLTLAGTTANNPGAAAGTNEVFITKLTDSGASSSFVWLHRAGGPGDDYVNKLVVSGNKLLLGGPFFATATFGSIGLTSMGNFDAFVTELVDNGSSASFAWAQQAGGPGVDTAFPIDVFGSRVAVGGFFTPLNNSPATFGTISLTGNNNFANGYLATFTDPTLTATTAARNDFAFTLAPNPAHGTASVQLPAVPGAATATLTLLDALGRPVRARPATPGTRTDFDLGGLAPGLYALRVAAGSATATQRLVVE